MNPAFAALWSSLGVNTVDEAAAKFLPDSPRPKVTVQRVAIEGVDAHFKLYQHPDGEWRFWLRRSKARIEFENYITFQRLRVPAAEPIACGEERDCIGRLRRAFIITRTVPHARGLDEFLRNRPARSERAAVARQLAAIVRTLHDDTFFYYDLVARNILVSGSGAESKVVLIDCPRGGFARFGLRRRMLRDLASLDKTASQFCSRTERLRFVVAYLCRQNIDAEVRSLARACVEYRRKRWPEDWRGK